MSDIVNTATIRVVADASGVEAGLRPAVEAARRTEEAVAQVGTGAATSARSVESAQRSIVQAIQRTTIAMEAGGKSTAAYYELLASQRGVDPAALAPYIAQLRAVEQAQAAVAHAAAAQQAEQLRAAESARVQAAAQRELVQAQATRDSFIAGLREQVALFGASTEEVLRYRAAQAGAAEAAEPLIAQLREMRAAQEVANQAARENAEAARAQAAAQRELAQAQTGREAFIAGLREQIQLFGRSTEEVLQYRAAQAGVSEEAAQLILQLQNMRAAQEQVAQAAREQAEAQRLAAREQAGRDTFIESLEEQVNAIGRTRVELLELRAAELGVSTQAAPFIARLREAEGGLARTGTSAAATAAALRTVPAQFTDIVTSLQGGQAPLTVLLQQGGQLRDQFGSAGSAARALGGYILGLINPYTVAAAAVGALALAYKSGADEAAAFQRALILSGNAAGATVNQLEDMRRNVAAISGSRDAANALAQLVQTAQVPADSLQQFAVLAVDAQRILGRSVEDTVGEFEKLGKSPLQALNAIDEKYHFISASTYAQVKALQDQGRMIDAANVAQQAYANGVQDQKDKVLATLNSWEKAWIGLKMYAADAANAIVDFAGGREASNQKKIDALLEQRDSIEENLKRAQKRGLTADVAAYQAELDSNERAINAIREKAKVQKDAAKAEADAQKVDDARKQWMADSDRYLTRQAQLERDIAKARNEGAAANLSSSEIEKRVADIRKSYADIFNAGIDSNIAALKRRDQVADVLEQRELARIAAARAIGGMSEGDAINATAKAELDAFDRKSKLLEAELGLTKKKANSVKEQADLEGQIAVVAEQRRNREIQQQNDLLALQEKRTRASQELYTKGLVGATAERDGLLAQVEAQFQYNQEIGLSKVQLAELKAARLDSAAALKEESAASLEAIDPASELAAKYREQAQALRDMGDAVVRGANKEQRVDQWKQAVDQYGQIFQQGFADMLNNGSAGWQSFTKSLVTTFKTSVADQIYKMFARPIIVQLVGSYLGVSQTAIAGEIASQPNGYGVTNGSGDNSAISAVQAASSLYKAINGGFETLSTSVADAVQAGMYQSGMTSQIASNGSFATSAGSATSVAAGMIGGHYLGNAISNGYGIGNHEQAVNNTGVAAGTGIGYYVGGMAGAALGALIGGAAGGFLNRIFGMGDKETSSQGIRGTLSASSLSGESYANWHQDGGWFRSDKDGTDVTALTDAMVKQFTSGLATIETVSAGFATSLGVQADSIKDYSKVFDLKLTGDATKDQQLVTDFFSGIGDEIANKLVPNLAEFAKSGEAASATLERLAGEFKGTDQVAQLLGRSAATLFGGTGVASAKARENLIDLAGGLSTLSSEASFFNQNFLTDAERIKPVAEALEKALGSLGLDTIPTTRDEFKGLINSLIDSGAAATDAGGKQLTSLLALADAFAQVHPQIDATADAAAKAAAALQAMKDAASTLLGGVDDAFSALQRVIAREKAAVQASVTAQTASVTKLQTLSQALRSTLDSLKSPDQKLAERAGAQAQIRAALATAKVGGPLPSAESLKNALSAVTQDASNQFSSYSDYLRDLLQTQSDIAQLGDLTDDSLSIEQKSLDALQAQLVRLDDIVANGQEQIDALKGESVATLTLAQAMAGLQGVIGGAQANPIVGATSDIASAYQQLLGRAPDKAGLAYWQSMIASGASLDAIRDAIMGGDEYKKLRGVPGFAAGGSFGGGVRLVGELGPEVEATGPARIHSTRSLVDALRSPSSNSEALVAEVKALRAEVQALRLANSFENAAIAKHTLNTSDHLDAAINGETPLATKAIGAVEVKVIP